MRPVVNVNLKVSQPADKKGNLKMGAVSIFQKDFDRAKTGELEAHWHTVKKEVIINGNTNITRIKSVNDDGEIKKSMGTEVTKKVRKMKAGKVQAKKLVQSIYSPRNKDTTKDQKEKERKADRAQEAMEGKAFKQLVKKVMVANIPRIGSENVKPSTPAPAAV